MLMLTLDNLKMENNKTKTYAQVTTPSGEIVRIFFLDRKHKMPQVRIGIDCVNRDTDVTRMETDTQGMIPQLVHNG